MHISSVTRIRPNTAKFVLISESTQRQLMCSKFTDVTEMTSSQIYVHQITRKWLVVKEATVLIVKPLHSVPFTLFTKVKRVERGMHAPKVEFEFYCRIVRLLVNRT